MPTPFPGMDPYLEDPSLWWGFHTQLIVQVHDMLVPQVRPAYWVDIEDRVYLDFEEDGKGPIGPDVYVVKQEREGSGGARPAAVTVAPTAVVEIPRAAPIREHPLKIIHRGTREVVCVIELLSPTNKRHGHHGRAAYLDKRIEVLQSTAHLIEIDLLRKGARAPTKEPLPATDYLALVHRTPRRPLAEAYIMPLRNPLPTLPVPLKEGDPDVALDLNRAVHATYDRGAYDIELDYRHEPDPPLAPESASWANELLQAAGLRSR